MVKQREALRRQMKGYLRAVGFTNEEIDFAFSPAVTGQSNEAIQVAQELDNAIAEIEKLYEQKNNG